MLFNLTKCSERHGGILWRVEEHLCFVGFRLLGVGGRLFACGSGRRRGGGRLRQGRSGEQASASDQREPDRRVESNLTHESESKDVVKNVPV